MTSRLKRKLDNMGVDASNVTESFCMIGTPLPPLEKADKNEFVPVWKQDVRDEKGRRRLHGAFTGGFSAGYFNTVGSKEGWTPSTFVSSRSARATAAKKGARPEDYMDEEDLAELKESQSLVDTTDSHDILGGTAAEMNGRTEPDESFAGVLQALVPDARESPGAKLLQRMGWRSGQGIGPRITYRKLKLLDTQSSSRPHYAAADDAEIEDEEASKHLYAPRDTIPISYRAKDNTFGLGYTPGMGLTEIMSEKSKEVVKGPQLSVGFGLGALNDAEDDDMDVYEGFQGPSDKRRLAYAGDDEDDERVLLEGRPVGSGRPNRTEKLPLPSLTSVHRFNDGRPVLSGFKLASWPILEDTWFEPPDIPADWEPDPKRVWSHNSSVKTSPPGDAKAKQISADERGAILGETPLVARSVFDYLSNKDRERIKNLSAVAKAGMGAADAVAAHTPPEVKIEIPVIDAQTAAAALRGFQPFTSDPVKQARYNAYLQCQVTLAHTRTEPIPMLGQSVEEFNKEMSDYAKAAQIFKPVTGAMASRFTSASTVELGPKPKEGLHMPTSEPEHVAIPAQEEVKVEETPKAHAARMGMFGPFTREAISWSPAKLLCKRFGVKDPHPDGLVKPDSTEPSSEWTGDTSTKFAPPHLLLPSSASSDIPGDGKENVPVTRKDISNVGLGDDEDQGRDILTYERPTIDIFKAIFASDDEDSEEEDQAEAVTQSLPGTLADKSQSQASTVPLTSGGQQLTKESSPLVPQEPKLIDSGVVDMSSFRPTFVSKAKREGHNPSKDGQKKEKKKKKDKQLIVSFDVEEGMESPTEPKDSSKKRKREKEARTDAKVEDAKGSKRKRKDGATERDADEGIWVEKKPPDIVLNRGDGTPREEPLADNRTGRKRAVDFL